MDFLGENEGLKMIKVKTADLLGKLKSNLELHKKEYTEASSGFKNHMIKELEKYLKKAMSGDFSTTSIHFEEPKSHIKDYEMMIEMLEMSVDEEVKVTVEQFRRYVKDEWDWTKQFKSLHTSYTRVV
jgi:hypothetical protein